MWAQLTGKVRHKSGFIVIQELQNQHRHRLSSSRRRTEEERDPEEHGRSS